MAHSFNIYWSIFNLYANKAKTKQSPWDVFISNTKKVMLKYIFNCCLISNKCQLGFVRSLRCKCSMHFLWPLSIRVHLRSKFQTAYYLFNNGNKKQGQFINIFVQQPFFSGLSSSRSSKILKHSCFIEFQEQLDLKLKACANPITVTRIFPYLPMRFTLSLRKVH